MINLKSRIGRHIIGGGILLVASVLSVFSVSAQNLNTVTGRVTDGDGAPLTGVVVSQQGTNNVSVTDAAGGYSLRTAADATLAFSLMGYTDVAVGVEGRSTIDIIMQQNMTAIDDVVVVGYGTVRKSDMTGAVSVLGDQKLRTVTTPRVEDMLSGKAPGVFVGAGSSQPGTQGVIIVRGKTSINSSTDPLWVVDGVIMGTSAGDLNPSDIESVTVLKDAASTAIYGSQGSNGVVIVSTKKGRTGKSTISFSAKRGLNYMEEGNLKMMNGEQLYDLFNSFPNKTFNTSWFNEDLKTRNFNWKDNLAQTGITNDYNVSIRGGNETLKTYVSLNWYDETGTVKGYEYQRLSGRFNADWKVFDWLTIKPSVSVARRNIDDRQHTVTAMYANLPWNSPYKSDGSIVGFGRDGDPAWVSTSGTAQNYLYNLQWNYKWERYLELTSGFDFNVKLTPWLTFESVNNYRHNNWREFTYTDPRTLANSQGGSIRNQTSETHRYYFNHLFRFNKTFNDLHNVSAIAAYEWNEYYSDSFDTTKLGVPAGGDNLALAANPSTTTGKVEDYAMQSFFVNATYAYGSRYYAQASIRRDGSSRFGKENRYGTFFALSGSWNIHEEAFFEKLRGTVNALKLRASYGSTGNLPNAYYGGYDTYSLSTQYAYNGQNGALLAGQAGNPTMTWETTYTTNLGVDLSMWNSRLNLSLDLYNKATSDLLWNTPLPSVTGLSNIYRNVGNVNNKGIEIALDGDIVRTTDWRWNLGINFGANRNRVVELYNNMTEYPASGDMNIAGIAPKLWKIGYDMDTWYLPEWAGVNPENGRPQWYTNDENGRNITENMAQAKQVMMGAYTPKFYGGFNTTLNWKFLDLSAVFSYSYGGRIFNYARVEYDSDGAYTDRNYMVLQKGWSRWTKPGDIATHPEARAGGNNGAQQASSRFLEDGSYLKLRNLTLGANIPLRSEVISGLRVYVSGENLVTLTKYSGVDPEIPVDNQRGLVNWRVVGTGTAIYPAVKRVVFGANITF